jgi:hypothetical protein
MICSQITDLSESTPQPVVLFQVDAKTPANPCMKLSWASNPENQAAGEDVFDVSQSGSGILLREATFSPPAESWSRTVIV